MLCFAVVLAKTWRIYYIFSNPSPAKKTKAIARFDFNCFSELVFPQVMKDKVLFIIILVIVGVDMVIIVAGTSVPHLRFIAKKECPDNIGQVSIY